MGGGIRPAGYARHHQAVVIFFIAVILTYISIAWKVIDKNIHPLPLRCWQFRLKELRIRTPSPMLGQVMFVCVPSALGQWN